MKKLIIALSLIVASTVVQAQERKFKVLCDGTITSNVYIDVEDLYRLTETTDAYPPAYIRGFKNGKEQFFPVGSCVFREM